ncbi:hypothetical protein PVK06_007599 [Gossypium arboreum]|uniref:Uncharacterized protein n=1 Tax=Gossypium arboreum TaxID=29729 RepID=A0ABR0QHR9_GOSAR|nr:hypothetical protein PVK06_007599 [Gossypium arboreum]
MLVDNHPRGQRRGKGKHIVEDDEPHGYVDVRVVDPLDGRHGRQSDLHYRGSHRKARRVPMMIIRMTMRRRRPLLHHRTMSGYLAHTAHQRGHGYPQHEVAQVDPDFRNAGYESVDDAL